MHLGLKSNLKCSVAIVALLTIGGLTTSANAQSVWAGPYLGVGVGMANSSSDADLEEPWDDEGYDRPYSDQLDGHGGALSVYAGVNWAAMNNVVWGVEGDLSWLGASPQTYLNHIDSYYDGVLRSETDLLGTLRLRAGISSDDTLFYLTGGLAYSNIKQSYTVAEKSIHFVRDEGEWGWVGGGGVEHRLTDSLSIRAEGLFSQFSGGDVSDSGGYFSPSVATDFDNTTLVVGRVGLAVHW